MRISDWSSDVCSSDLLGTTGDLTGSGRGDAHIDRRSGRVQGKGSADAHGRGSADGQGDLLGQTIGGSASGSGDASGSGSLDAQAVGTDFVGQTARGAVGRDRKSGVYGMRG